MKMRLQHQNELRVQCVRELEAMKDADQSLRTDIHDFQQRKRAFEEEKSKFETYKSVQYENWIRERNEFEFKIQDFEQSKRLLEEEKHEFEAYKSTTSGHKVNGDGERASSSRTSTNLSNDRELQSKENRNTIDVKR